jgi:osmoprotectant transport system substrate-binding protein
VARITRLGRTGGLAAIVLLLVAAACSGPGDRRAGPTALGDDAITVASFDFPESETLAAIYGGALRAAGYTVLLAPRLGPRESVEPALARGLVEVVPEYAGTALEFLSLGAVHPTADLVSTHADLDEQLRHRGLLALAPAPAANANAFVMTRETADRLDVRALSDLVPIARRLTIGGPPECPARPFCLQGLERVYDLHFAEFLPLDAGGPLTRQALDQGLVDVGLMFTTDPSLDRDDYVVLEDDRGLQPAENITPIAHRRTIDRFGQELVEAIDLVSARLTQAELKALNARVADGDLPSVVAADWLDEEGLA